MKRRMARLLACFMAVMLLASGMPEGFWYKEETSKKEHKAYAAVTGYINSYSDLKEAAATGGVYVLANSIVLTNKLTIPDGVELTLLQEIGGCNKITTVNLTTGCISVEEGASLTLGSKDTEVLVVDGSNLDQGVDLFNVGGTLTIENADLSCPNGYGIWVDGKLYMNDGYIHDCLAGILIYHEAEGVISGGIIADCKGTGVVVSNNASCKMTGGIIANVSYGMSCSGVCTMTGGLVTECDIGVCTDSLFTDASKVSFVMNGGVVSNSKTYALYSEGGSIYLTGGKIQNGRCGTYSKQSRAKASFYIGGTPYLDDNSFILVHEGMPLIQMADFSAPTTEPHAKINIYGMTTEQPLVTALSEDTSLLDSLELYQPYDRDFTLSVKDNQIYMEGTKEIDTKVYPTVRPATSDATEQPTASEETRAPMKTEEPMKSSLPWSTIIPIAATEKPMQSFTPFTTMVPVPTEEPRKSSMPQTTAIPTAITEEPMQSSMPQITTIPSVATEEPMQSSMPQTTTLPIAATDAPAQSSVPQTTAIPTEPLETPVATQQASIPILSGESTPEPVATQNVYEEFSSTRPEITKISAKGLNFQLQWKFSSAVPVKEYAIYYSSDQKKYSLIKTVEAETKSTSVSVSKAYNGKKIYFYVVAKTTDAVSGNVYQSEKSYVASKYLIDKVMGMTGSYHTSTQKLIVKWKKVSNCTGYHVYIKACCNGKTLTKRCATVSKKKNSVSISTRKIKQKFSSNGKPIRIKKYSVRAFYKKGKKTAYSPN